MADGGVSNGQLANQTTFNNGFMSRNGTQTDTTSKVDLINADAASGASVVNTQREVNSLNAYTGRPAASAHNATPTWTNNEVGTSSDTLKMRAEALTLEFNTSSGHDHDGVNSKLIDITDVQSINQFRADKQTFTIASAAGTSDDITASMSGKTPGGGTSTAGVITTAPNNRVTLTAASSETAIEDTEGQRVYGRITESSGTWTISYYTLEAGVETAFSMPTQNVNVFFNEVFTLATLPTIGADMGQIPSLDMTSDIVDATATIAGKVSTVAQTFGGDKTFQDAVKVSSELYGEIETDAVTTANAVLPLPTKTIYRVTDSSLTDIEGITAVADEQMFELVNNTGNSINILNEFASASTDIVTGIAQDFILQDGQVIRFVRNTATSRWHMVGGGSPPLTVGALDALSPSGDGAQISANVLYMQSAGATNPGLMTANSQTFAGNKTFNNRVTIGQGFILTEANDATSGSAVTLSIPSHGIKRLTSGTLVSVGGIDQPVNGQVLVVYNDTGVTVTILNEDGSTTAAERIFTGTGADISLSNNAALWLAYSTGETRWIVVGGSGGVATLGAIGATPNANGATITGSTLNLEPASASFGGVVTTGTQTFAGVKTLDDELVLNDILVGDSENDGVDGADPTAATPVKLIKIFDDEVTPFTGLGGITAPSPARNQVVILANYANVGTVAMIRHENSGTTAANRFYLAGERDLEFPIGSSILAWYNTEISRWMIVGGGGSGSPRISSELSLSNTDSIFIYTTSYKQTTRVGSSGGAITVSVTPFGPNPPPDGAEILLVGTSDTDTVTVSHNDAADGCLLNGDCTLGRGQTLRVYYDATLDRYCEVSRSH